MIRTVTFYGAGRDALGMPVPTNRYLIDEAPAVWVGPTAFFATIFATVNAPMPVQQSFLVPNGNAGDALQAAIAALAALPANAGLTMI